MINNDTADSFFKHDGRILYGNPIGTYFFRNHTHGQIALVFSVGGTKMGLLTIETKPDGKTAITNPGHRKTFDSEVDFLRVAKEERLNCPAFPHKFIKLTSSVNELKHSVPSLKYLSTLSILKNPVLREKVWECEDQKVPEEMEDYFYDVDQQLDAEKIALKL